METKVNESAQEAKETFLEQCMQAMESEHWMGLIITAEPGNRLRIARTCCQFPHSEMIPAVDRIREMLMQELFAVTSSPPQEPLPLAPHLNRRNNGQHKPSEEHENSDPE